MMMSKGLLISIFVLSCFAPSSFSKAQSFDYVSHDYGFNQIPPRGGTLFIKLKLLLHPNLSLCQYFLAQPFARSDYIIGARVAPLRGKELIKKTRVDKSKKSPIKLKSDIPAMFAANIDIAQL